MRNTRRIEELEKQVTNLYARLKEVANVQVQLAGFVQALVEDNGLELAHYDWDAGVREALIECGELVEYDHDGNRVDARVEP